VTFGSLFSGIGGMDLGLERAGMQCKWQVESNEQCQKLLRSKFGADIWGDIRRCHWHLPPVDVVAGGDPCPKHSRARSNGESKSPDLSGYFLAVVGRLCPKWVVRENVPAPTVIHFATCLETLGYGTVIIRIDGATLTGQSRQRDFVIGCHTLASGELARTVFSDCQDGPGPYTTSLGTGQVTPALTTHRTRYDARDCYIWNERYGLRILESEERERLAGFPKGWTVGFSVATRAKMCGNALIPAKAEWIGKRILECE